MLDSMHVELKTHSLAAAREFYVGKLGLQVLQEMPQAKLLALSAGTLRISIFEVEAVPAVHSAHIIYRVPDLSVARATLEARGVRFEGDLREAPGFMRYLLTRDPDGRPVEIAQYLRDPLVAVS